jgi:HK97 family phage prohead protease
VIERAIIQETYSRDGVTLTRECPRPDAVRSMARRLMQWRDVREGCQRCGSDNAIAVRGAQAVCVTCLRESVQQVAAIEPSPFPAAVRAEGQQGDGVLRGYAIVFHDVSVDLGGFREVISPSAVRRMVSESPDVRALVNHDSSHVIGRSRAGTLTYKADKRGLSVEIDPPRTTIANDLLVSVERRDISGMSFAFQTVDDHWELDDDGYPRRSVLDMRVSEVSVVSFPAYPTTTIDVGRRGQRSIDWLYREHRTRMAK